MRICIGTEKLQPGQLKQKAACAGLRRNPFTDGSKGMVSVRKRKGVQSQTAGTVVEKGDIFFAYRPRVTAEGAGGLGDVQRFFMVLKPEGKALFRVAILGRKRLPEAKEHERIWGFIESVTREGGAVEEEFKERRYRTATRGKRTLPSARPAGEGIYALLLRGRNLYLTYELELPQKPGEVQQELNIAPQGAYILSIKNPEKESPPGTGLPKRDEADYPEALEKEFRGRRFASEGARFLDYEGAEFVLVGARTDPERAYEIDIETEDETARNADIFRQLKMSARDHPADPLIRGRWR
jgi:hypothetical protein